MRRRVSVIGSGRAAAALTRALRGAGHRVASAPGRSGRPALERLARRSDIVLLCVADAAIEEVAGRLACLPEPALAGKVILHTSGAQGPEPLRGLSRRGASIGSLHPLISFPPRGGPKPSNAGPAEFKGVGFAVDGSPPARMTARALAMELGGHPLSIPAAKRPAYHMMATLVASGMAALLHAAVEVARERLGMPEPAARRALMPLARSVLANVSEHGVARGLTGPAARGDVRTVVRHMKTLSGSPAAVRELYEIISRRAVLMALADKRLDARSAASLMKALAQHRRD